MSPAGGVVADDIQNFLCWLLIEVDEYGDGK